MTIYLHIGSPKTGTTSFQNFCSSHREKLLASGILYPRTLGNVAHTHAPLYAADFSVKFSAKRQKLVTSEAALESHRKTIKNRLYDEIAKSRASHVLVSSEHLYVSVIKEHEIGRLRDLFSPLQRDIKILVYLRRRDEFALSLYAEAVRMGYAGSLDEYMKHGRTVRLLDYRTTLRRWASVFGPSNIVLRIFDRSQLVGGDVIADILNQIGAPSELAKTADASWRMRESLPGDALAFLVRLNAAVNKLLKGDSDVSLDHFRSPIFRERLVETIEKGSNGEDLCIADDVRERLFGRFHDDDASLFAGYGVKIAKKQTAPAQHRAAQLTVDAAIEFAARLWIDRECTLLEITPRHFEQLQLAEEASPAPYAHDSVPVVAVQSDAKPD